MSTHALFEAQREFEGIEQFISRKFNIPMEARILRSDLNADLGQQNAENLNDIVPQSRTVMDAFNYLYDLDYRKEKITEYLKQVKAEGFPEDKIGEMLDTYKHTLADELTEKMTREFTELVNPDESSDENAASRVEFVNEVISRIQHIHFPTQEELEKMGYKKLQDMDDSALQQYLISQMLDIISKPVTMANFLIRLKNYIVALRYMHSSNPLDLKSADNVEISLRNPPKVVTLVSYIRNAATAAMTHSVEFGIGSSEVYRNQGADETAGINPDNIHVNNLLSPDTYPESLKNYVAMLSRQFLPGILRIAFNELNLMAYIVREHPEIVTYMSMIPGAAKPDTFGKFSYQKLDFFGKTVIPIVVARELLSRSQPGKFKDKTTYCDPSTMAETRRYLGDEVTDMFIDNIDPAPINLDANLADRDGQGELSLSDLVEVMDIGDITRPEIINRTSRNSKGDELRFVPKSEEDDDKDKKHELFSRVSDEDLECPAYKAGEWYVVKVDDMEHSKHGWFNMPESPSGRFYFRGGDDPANFNGGGGGHGVDNWCIVYHDSWPGYVQKSENDYAYYYIHESALKLSYNDPGYDASAFGVVFCGTDTPKIGLVRSNQSRKNCGAVGSKKDNFMKEYMKFFPMRPENQIVTDNTTLRIAVNNAIAMLCLIGEWDNSVRGDDNIIRKAQELSMQWFPPKPGVELGQQAIKYAIAHDMDEAASIISVAISNANEGDVSLLDKFTHQKFTINIGDTQWALAFWPPSWTTFKCQEGNLIFVPYEAFADKIGVNIPSIAFHYDPDADVDKSVTPLTDSPIPFNSAMELQNNTTVQETPSAPAEEINGMYLAPAFGGNSGKRRIAIGQDGVTLYAVGPETEGNPEPIGQLGGQQTNARNILDRRATYFAVDGGYNICIGRNSTDTGDSPIKYIGFARDGKKNIQMFSVNMVLSGGNLLLETPGAGTLRLGNLRGDLVRQREDRYGSFLFCIDNHTVVDGVNLVPETLSLIADRHAGDIGMVTISGDFMANLANNGLVGTVDWFDSATLSNKGQSRLTANMLNRNTRETPSVMHV